MKPQKEFFESLFQRKFVDCEAIITELHSRHHGRKNLGYIHALEGLIVAVKDKDQKAYFNKLPEAPKELKRLKKSFRDKIEKKGVLMPLHDKGFFKAWTDLFNWLIAKEPT